MDIGPNTISRYLEHLQDAFIISEALRYDVKERKYIGTETKDYFEDMGIRNAILDFRQIEFTHTMENVIYNELRRLGYGVDVGLVETMKRNAEGKNVRSNLEIDFVVNRHDERIYIQSAYALPDKEKEDQEMASLRHVSDNFKKIVIVGTVITLHTMKRAYSWRVSMIFCSISNLVPLFSSFPSLVPTGSPSFGTFRFYRLVFTSRDDKTVQKSNRQPPYKIPVKRQALEAKIQHIL